MSFLAVSRQGTSDAVTTHSTRAINLLTFQNVNIAVYFYINSLGYGDRIGIRRPRQKNWNFPLQKHTR